MNVKPWLVSGTHVEFCLICSQVSSSTPDGTLPEAYVGPIDYTTQEKVKQEEAEQTVMDRASGSHSVCLCFCVTRKDMNPFAADTGGWESSKNNSEDKNRWIIQDKINRRLFPQTNIWRATPPHELDAGAPLSTLSFTSDHIGFDASTCTSVFCTDPCA